MTLLFSLLLSIFSSAVPDSIIGTWQRTLVTTDESTETEETQIVLRTFAEPHVLTETVVYEQRVQWTDDETVLLRFRSAISGQWVANGRDILLNYLPNTLEVWYEGVAFPDHDAALQVELRRIFEKKNAKYLRNYQRTMKNVLRNYFRRNSGSAILDVEFQGQQFTAKLGKELVAFQRVEEE